MKLLGTVISLTLLSCGFAERKMYTNLDESGAIFLSRYTTLIPTLGPCGFTRNEAMYEVHTPRTHGRIDADELHIMEFTQDTAKYQYAGYIEFITNDTILVELYKITKSHKIALKINGKNKIKIEENKIGDKKI